MDLAHRTRKLVAGVALAGAVTAGTAGVAVAADGDAPSGPPTTAAEHHPRRAIRHLGGIVAETLGVERVALRQALRSGQSIAEYAASLGQDPQVVVDALLDAVQARVDRAVADGRISAERGEESAAAAPERVDALVNRHFGQGQAR